MKLDKFIPDIYKKNILEVDYKKLKVKGIKCILFDLDNTLAIIDENKVDKEIQKLLTELKEDFQIIIISNNFRKRIRPICDMINIDFISFAMKPYSRSFNKVLKKYNYNKNQMCLIGDQLITDILGGNLYGITSILVDPLSIKDLKITKVNRFLESIILKKLSNQNKLKRGTYYG